MKNLVVLAISFLFVSQAFAQKLNMDEINVKPPKYETEMYKSENEFFQQNAEFSARDMRDQSQGTSVVRFTVTPEGTLEDIEITNSISINIDNQMLRLLEATNGKWTPGTVNGEAVSMETEVQAMFSIHETYNLVQTAKNYQQRGNKLLFEKNNPKRALRQYEQALKILPKEEGLIAMKGLSLYQLGDVEAAYETWAKIENMENAKAQLIAFNPENIEGYNEMLAMAK